MNLTKEFISNQYLKFGKSGYRIAKDLNIPRYLVDNAITKYKIKRRSLLVSRLPVGSSGSPRMKWCPGCKRDISLIGFSMGNGRNKKDSLCKSCKLEYSKKFYNNRNKTRQKRKAALVLDFGNKCNKCGVKDLPIGAFVFHHHSEKMSAKGYQQPSDVISNCNIPLRKEKKKWILLCANCHHIVHSNSLSATKYSL